MRKKILMTILCALALLSMSVSQTVDLVWRSTDASVAKSVMVELETGALDLFFSDGLIVTTAGSIIPARDEDLPRLLAEAKDGRAQWLFMVDILTVAGAKPTSPPEALSYRLFRVRDGLRVLEGRILAPEAGDSGLADPTKRMRATGNLAAKAVLAALRTLEARLDDGIAEISLKGG